MESLSKPTLFVRDMDNGVYSLSIGPSFLYGGGWEVITDQATAVQIAERFLIKYRSVFNGSPMGVGSPDETVLTEG